MSDRGPGPEWDDALRGALLELEGIVADATGDSILAAVACGARLKIDGPTVDVPEVRAWLESSTGARRVAASGPSIVAVLCQLARRWKAHGALASAARDERLVDALANGIASSCSYCGTILLDNDPARSAHLKACREGFTASAADRSVPK